MIISMKNILKTLCILSSVLLSAAVTSCVDERLYIDPEIGEGEATLTASVVFSPCAMCSEVPVPRETRSNMSTLSACSLQQ